MLVGGGHLLAIVNFKEYLACNLYSQHYSLGTAAPWPFAVSVQQHTHTHNRLTALFPGLPGWASTRKVKPIWI